MAGPSREDIDLLWSIHNSDERRRENLLRAYGFDTARTWVDPNGYTLSTRVWRARKAVYTQIDQVLREAIANGTDALEVADILEQYLNPELAPVRNALGRLIRKQKPVIVTRAPGRGGMGSFSARRLARTEITRAHGQATIETAKRTPFAVGVKWNLSGSHPRSDPCDENSRRDAFDLGPGVYPPNDVPQYPNHSNCLCNLSAATEDDVDSVVRRLREQYDLADGATSEAQQPWEQPFERITDKKQATEWFARYGVQVAGAEDASLTVLNTWAEGYHNLRSRGYELAPSLYFEAIAQGSTKSGSMAAYYRDFDRSIGVNLSSSHWKSVAKNVRQEYASGFKSTYDPLHSVYHETGHFLHFQRYRELSNNLPGVENGRVVDVPTWAAADDELKDRMFGSSLTGDQRRVIERQVSRYGATDASETVAEVFAGHMGDKSKVRRELFSDDVRTIYELLGGPTTP